MDAAEVLPCSAMSRAILTRSGSFIARAIASVMRMLAWCGTKTSRSSTVTPARSSACWPIFAISNDAQRNTALPCITRCGISGFSLASTSRQSSRCRIRSNCSPSEPQTTGPMPGVVAGSDDDGAGAVGEDERGAAVGAVGDVGEPLDADHQDVAGAAAADHVGGQRDAVAEAGAGGGDVERGGRSVPSSWAIAVATAGVWNMWVTVATIDAVDLPGVDAGPLERRTRGGDRHHLHGLLRRREAALLDAGALLDPLVAGVDRVDDLGVRDHRDGPVGADAEDRGVPGALGLADRGHQWLPPSGCSRISG